MNNREMNKTYDAIMQCREYSETYEWKELDEACRRMAVMSSLDKDLSDYQMLKQMYQ